MPTLTEWTKAKDLVNSHRGYQLEAAIADALAAERERCARIADSAINDMNGQRKAGMARAIARRIRDANG